MKNAKYYGEQAAAKFAEAKKIVAFAEEQNREITPEEQASIETIIAEAEKLKGFQHTNEKLEVVESSMKASGGRISNYADAEPIHKDIGRYSLMRALQNQLEYGRQTGLEAEVSAEIAKRNGRNPQGFFMPLQFGNLDLTSGAGAVDTIKDHDNFIELLRNRMVTTDLGVRVMSDLSGNIQLPKQSGGATAYWISADGSSSITDSNQDLSTYVPLSPKTCGVTTTYTRAFLRQTSMDVEAFVREDLAKVHALALDKAILAGTGSSNQPEGVQTNSSVSTVSMGTNGDVPTFAKLIEMETKVAAGNADLGKLAYVTTAAARGKMKGTPIASNTARFIWENDTINGYKAYATNQLSSALTKGTGTALSAVLFGNWDDVILGLFGSGVDIVINPYATSKKGSVEVTLMQEADVAIRHPESFSKIVDLVTV